MRPFVAFPLRPLGTLEGSCLDDGSDPAYRAPARQLEAPEPRVRDDYARMSDKRSPGVLGGLPRTRPHRRSDKRAARPEPGARPETDSRQVPATRPAPTAPIAVATTARSRRTAATQPAKARATQPVKARAARPAEASATQPAQPRATRPRAAQPSPAAPSAPHPPAPEPGPPTPLGTAVQAAAELAEIGVTVSVRALRGALSRLPRP